ncbi:MAG TPA: O-acetyl-ADP-ribose deacetylase [Thermomicrobiales bacterium]|nr:O-acetyl-ADP-ribose deacetylase [Thermomicrobiales bacterium]
MAAIEIVQGDITRMRVDAIVNAANTSLLGGGGVDGAIHRAAGPQLLAACRELGGCPTGRARITPGFELPARWIVHTPGPVWEGGTRGEDELLEACYYNALMLASLYDAHTIAFPAISTGAYRFPVERAANIAVRTAARFLADDASIDRVSFVCRGGRSIAAHEAALANLGPLADHLREPRERGKTGQGRESDR